MKNQVIEFLNLLWQNHIPVAIALNAILGVIVNGINTSTLHPDEYEGWKYWLVKISSWLSVLTGKNSDRWYKCPLTREKRSYRALSSAGKTYHPLTRIFPIIVVGLATLSSSCSHVPTSGQINYVAKYTVSTEKIINHLAAPEIKNYCERVAKECAKNGDIVCEPHKDCMEKSKIYSAAVVGALETVKAAILLAEAGEEKTAWAKLAASILVFQRIRVDLAASGYLPKEVL